MIRKVIVFGATGKTGIKICEHLNANKIQHIAFVRQESKEKMKSQSTEIICGNVLNPDDIEKAFTATEFTDVVIALGTRDLKGSNIRSVGTKNIIDVLDKLSMNCKIHAISALGVRESWVQLNWLGKLICKVLINSSMKDHGLQEDIIIKSSRKFHIIRPVALTDGTASGNIINQTEGFLPANDISRDDVAKYLVESMLTDKIGFSSICKAN